MCSVPSKLVDRRFEIERMRRSIAMLAPKARDALGREDALAVLLELQEVQGRLDTLKAELGRLAEES
jgi:hypothetical protein